MQASKQHSPESQQPGIPLVARWFMPTMGNVTFLTIIYFLLSDNNSFLDDGDTGVHIRIGDLIRQTGAIPRIDPFSFTMPGHKWLAWEWLTDIFMSWIHSISGLTGIVYVACIIVCIVFMLLYKRMLASNCNPFVALFLTAFAAMVSGLHWMARPHLVSWLLLSIACIMLESYRRHRTKWIYLMPFLVALWANLHGAFVIIFPMLAIYILGEIIGAYELKDLKNNSFRSIIKPYLFAGILSAIASLATPYGWLLHKHIWSYLNDSSLLGLIIEFQSPDFHTTVGKMVEIILILGIITIVQAAKKHRWIDIGILLLFMHLMLQSVRHIPVAAIVVFPIIGENAGKLLRELINDIAALKNNIGRFSLNFKNLITNSIDINNKLSGYGFYFIAIPILFAVIAGPSGEHFLNTNFNPKLHPVEAAEFIETSGLQGNVFSSDEYGDYLIYKFYPKIKVFIDGRSDFYNTGNVVKDYQKLMNLDPSWSELLDTYKVQWLLLEKNAPLGLVAQMSGSWKRIYNDDVSQILIKKTDSEQPQPKGRGIERSPEVD